MLKHIRHLIGYDLRALRTPLVVWILVLVAEAILLLAGPVGSGSDSPFVGYDFGVLLVRLALTAVLVALVVQRDALVGTTVFWRTRPIARGRLLASKVATVCMVVIVLPWLVMVGVLVGLGVAPPAALRGALSVAAEQFYVAVLAFVAATLTANLAQLLIVELSGITVVMVFLALLRAIAYRGGWVVVVAAGWASGVFTTAIIVGAVAVAVHQFLTLRTGRSMTFMAGALALATFGGALWHPMLDERDTRGVDPSVLAPEAVRLQVSKVRWSSRRTLVNGAFEENRDLSGVLTPEGAPDEILLTVDSVDLSLRYGGRTVAERHFRVPGGGGQAAGRTAQPNDQPYRSIRAALRDTELVLRPNTVAREVWVTLASISEDAATRLTESDGVIDGTVGLRAFRYVVAGRAKLAVGGSLTTASQHSTIEVIGPVVRVLGVPGEPHPGVDITLRSTVVGRTPWFGLPLPLTGSFLLRNEARHQTVFLTPWGSSGLTPVLGLLGPNAADVWTGSQRLEFDALQSSTPFPFDDEWLRDAELLLIEPRGLGVVTRPLHIEDVPAPAQTGER